MKKEKEGIINEMPREAVEKAEFFCVSQKLVIFDEKEKKFLLLKNANIDRWELPGGTIEKDEQLEDTLARETQEEIGDVRYENTKTIGALRTVYKALGKEYPILMLGYSASYQGGDVCVGDEHIASKWMTREEIEKESDDAFNVGTKRFINEAIRTIESDEYLTDLKRLQADFENYKKRQAESQKELGGYLIEKLLFDIIPVLDNFRMATAHVPEDAKDSPWVTGIGYIEKQLEDALAGHGVSVIEVKEGDAFDPNIHEAVDSQQATDSSRQEADNKKQETEVVAKVLQNGYRIGDRVVRPVKVTVKSS